MFLLFIDQKLINSKNKEKKKILRLITHSIPFLMSALLLLLHSSSSDIHLFFIILNQEKEWHYNQRLIEITKERKNLKFKKKMIYRSTGAHIRMIKLIVSTSSNDELQRPTTKRRRQKNNDRHHSVQQYISRYFNDSVQFKIVCWLINNTNCSNDNKLK